MDVLVERVKPILMRLCANKKADEYVFVNPDTEKPTPTSSDRLRPLAGRQKVRDLEWHDLRATFCTRLASAGYDAFTIKTIMGHRDMKTTERYVRAVRLTKQVGFVQSVHKLPTK